MFRTPPFRRAPVLLFRHRVVLLAVLGATAILGLVVALTPQFLSSASSEALARELGGRCASSYAGSFRPTRQFEGFVRYPGVTEENRVRLVEAIGDQRNLAEPRATVIGRTLGMRREGEAEPAFNLTLLYRSGYEDQVEIVRGGDETGVWIDEYTSDTYDINVGDSFEYEFTVELADMTPRTIKGELTVGAIVTDLADRRNQSYWCGVGDLLGLSPTGDRPPPVGLVSLETFGDGIYPEFEEPSDEFFLRSEDFWELPVELDGITLDIGGEIVEKFTEVSETVASNPEAVNTDLDGVVGRIEALSAALTTSVRPLAIAVVVVAFGLMAGAGSYWVDRRAGELRLLSSAGVGPGMIGLKAALEMMIPIVVGVGAGTLLAIPITAAVGPGGTVEPAAISQSLRFALPTMILALALVGVVGGLRSRQLLIQRSSRSSSRWWTVPMAAVLLLGAFVARQAIGEQAVEFGPNQLVGVVDPKVILFPLLLFGGVVLVAAEIFVAAARRWKGDAASNVVYLALRRITSNPGPVVVLIAGALIPVATLAYSAALTRSTSESIETKGRIFIGSDLRAPVYEFDQLPEALAVESTYVRRADRVDFGEVEVDLLVVDPETFPNGAFWDDALAEESLESLLAAIDTEGDRLKAIAANGDGPSEEGLIDLARYDLPVEIVATAASFPGARIDRPIVVVARQPFDDFVSGLDLPPGIDGTDKFLWTKNGDSVLVEQYLSQAEIGFSFTTTLEEALDLTKFQAIIWTFDFLELYAALSGLIVIGAILLYADTRQRQRNLSYALAVRMGLTRGEHLRAGFLEFGGVILFGGVLGLLTAHSTARSMYRALDALPNTPPTPRWVGVVDLGVLLAVVSLGVGFAAAYIAQRTADNADVSELLRHGE